MYREADVQFSYPEMNALDHISSLFGARNKNKVKHLNPFCFVVFVSELVQSKFATEPPALKAMKNLPFDLITSINLPRLLRSKHAILHQSPLERSVHSLQTVCIPNAFQIFGRLEDPSDRIVNSNPNRVTPRCNGGGDPIGGFDGSHQFGGVDEFFVGFDGDEVWVRPSCGRRTKKMSFFIRKFVICSE
jgi:hypothetical protein